MEDGRKKYKLVLGINPLLDGISEKFKENTDTATDDRRICSYCIVKLKKNDAKIAELFESSKFKEAVIKDEKQKLRRLFKDPKL